MTENDVSSAPSEERAVSNERVSPLTDDQRAFAEVVGREIARHWRETQENGRSEGGHGSQDAIQDKPGCVSAPKGIAAGLTASPV